MDFRNKYLLNTIRILLGLFMIFSGVTGFMVAFAPDPTAYGVPAEQLPMNTMLWDIGLFQMIKATEIIAGLMLVIGFLPWLAAIFLAPVAIGVIVVNARIAPAYLPTGIIFAALVIYLGYAYWPKYKALFERK